MIYVVSDVHGCLDSLKAVLKQAAFDESSDVLYILGDIVDRGPLIWETYEWVKERINKSVFMILGNHEDMLINDVFSLKGKEIKNMKRPPVDEKEEKYLNYLRKNFFIQDQYMTIRYLTRNGHTLDELVEMCEFFDELPLYYEIDVNGKTYTLVHAFCEEDIKATNKQDLIWKRFFAELPEYFCDNKTVVYGHTPTIFYDKGGIVEDLISKDGKSEKINIDCGCVFGNKLALMRLDDKKIWYQDCLEQEESD